MELNQLGPVSQAMIKAFEARSIMNDGGISVFGWEVQSPYAAASGRIAEAQDLLAGVEGAGRQIGFLYEVAGELGLLANINAPKEVARRAYEQALINYEQSGDFDSVTRVAERFVSLGRGLR